MVLGCAEKLWFLNRGWRLIVQNKKMHWIVTKRSRKKIIPIFWRRNFWTRVSAPQTLGRSKTHQILLWWKICAPKINQWHLAKHCNPNVLPIVKISQRRLHFCRKEKSCLPRAPCWTRKGGATGERSTGSSGSGDTWYIFSSYTAKCVKCCIVALA